MATFIGGVFLYATKNAHISDFQKLFWELSDFSFIYHNGKSVSFAPLDYSSRKAYSGSYFLSTQKLAMLPVTQRSATIYGATNYKNDSFNDNTMDYYGKSTLGAMPTIGLQDQILLKVLYGLDSEGQTYKQSVKSAFSELRRLGNPKNTEYCASLIFAKSGFNSNLVLTSEVAEINFYLFSYFGSSILIWSDSCADTFNLKEGMKVEFLGTMDNNTIPIFPKNISNHWARWFSAVRHQDNYQEILCENLQRYLELDVGYRGEL